MKCPNCGFVSFEYLESCRKCSKDLTNHKSQFGIDFMEPMAISTMAFAMGATSAPAVSAETSDDGFETDDFSFGGLSDDGAAGQTIAEGEDEGISLDFPVSESDDEEIHSAATQGQDDDGAIEIDTDEANEAELAVDGGGDIGFDIENDTASVIADEPDAVEEESSADIGFDLAEDAVEEESSVDIEVDLAEDEPDLEPPPIPTEDDAQEIIVGDDIGVDVADDDEISLDFGGDDDDISLDEADEKPAEADDIALDVADDDEISLDFGDDDDDISLDEADEEPAEADDIGLDVADDDEISLDFDEEEPAKASDDPLEITDLGLDDPTGIGNIPDFGETPVSDPLGEPDITDSTATPEDSEEFDLSLGNDVLNDETSFGVDIVDEDKDGAPEQIEKMGVEDQENGIQQDVEISLAEFDDIDVDDDNQTDDKIEINDSAFEKNDSDVDITLSEEDDSSSDGVTDDLLDFGDDDIGDSDITLGDDSSPDKLTFDDTGDGDDFLGELDFDFDDDDKK